jgi:hypothetical protein
LGVPQRRVFVTYALRFVVQVVNLKNGSTMKYLDPTKKQITGMMYCAEERAVITTSINGQVCGVGAAALVY